MRALTGAGLVVAGGAAAGGATHLLDAGAPQRATAGLFALFGLACAAGAVWNARGPTAGTRCRRGAFVLAVTFGAAWVCAAVAGLPSAIGGAAIVAGAATAACGAASMCRASRIGASHAPFAGAFAVAATAGILFVADPFVEWDGGGPGTRGRAETVVSINPLASIAADAGLDWQRSRWLYDGPWPGTAGLSSIGQYYPSRTTPPWTWGLCAAGLGIAALALARTRIAGDRLPA